MSFERYWSDLTNRNSGLNDESQKMTISVTALKAALERAFNAGAADQQSLQAALDKIRCDKNTRGDLFGGIFGNWRE